MQTILSFAAEISPLQQTLSDAFFAFTVTPVAFVYGIALWVGWSFRDEFPIRLGRAALEDEGGEDE